MKAVNKKIFWTKAHRWCLILLGIFSKRIISVTRGQSKRGIYSHLSIQQAQTDNLPLIKHHLAYNIKFLVFKNKFFVLAPNSIIIFLSVFLYGCTPSPEPINYGKDECEHCRMMITDIKYGAEIFTDKGKVHKFDSIECLIEFALEKNIIGVDSHSFLVTDFSATENLIDTKTAFFVHNDNFRSPMGLNVTAFENEKDMKKFITENDGKFLTWLEVIELVKQSVM